MADLLRPRLAGMGIRCGRALARLELHLLIRIGSP
jgi:hypothetical protein